ncbi:flagellar hook-length control protein FliK [Tepidibacillus fermentans]|uniref:Flagellar hook-length control protein FliK n=1 Tax=Tepidibacillus fermentans TaxID=1281767 RepID=A0A4R3KHZ0_9BACI|nr:flagellar hook-length control protein FliK [Tepidibacillus fermentans]TCS82941.1 flagellar hook-length control protein FliK [Tepidibacillus fermentans]
MNTQIANGISSQIIFQNQNSNSLTNVVITPVTENVSVNFSNLLIGLMEHSSLLQTEKQELESVGNVGLSNGNEKSQENTKQDKGQNDFINPLIGSLFQIPLTSESSAVIQTITELPSSQLQVLEQLLEQPEIQGNGIKLQGITAWTNETKNEPIKFSDDPTTMHTNYVQSNTNQSLDNTNQLQNLSIIGDKKTDSVQQNNIGTTLYLKSSNKQETKTVHGNMKFIVTQGQMETQGQIQQLLAKLGIRVVDGIEFQKSMVYTQTNTYSTVGSLLDGEQINSLGGSATMNTSQRLSNLNQSPILPIIEDAKEDPIQQSNIETILNPKSPEKYRFHPKEIDHGNVKLTVIQGQMETQGQNQQLQRALDQLGISLDKVEFQKDMMNTQTHNEPIVSSKDGESIKSFDESIHLVTDQNSGQSNQITPFIIKDAKVITTYQNKSESLPLTHNFANELGKVIVKHVQLPSGVSETKIQLHPQELGQIDVKITSHQGQISAQLVADTLVAKELMEGQIQQLRQSLIQQGFIVERIEVQHVPSSPATHSFQDMKGGFQFSQQQQTARQFSRPKQNLSSYYVYSDEQEEFHGVAYQISGIDYTA